MLEYKLGTGSINGRFGPIVLTGGAVHFLTKLLGEAAPSTLEEVFADWARIDPAISAALHSLSGGADPAKVTYAPPMSDPRKVICIGTNYHDHLQEMKVTTLPDFPYGFLRPQTCLAGHEEDVPLPSVPKMVDWEAELGIIIGRTHGPDSTGDPLGAVAGYTVINDVSARDWIQSRPFVGIDWVMQKAFDKFQPTGPWITPARFVKDPGALDIALTVNGVTKQSSNTSNLIFGVPEMLRHLSGIMTLEPGDIIATGTPAGVGYGLDPQEFLKPGDVVEVTIDGLGTLRNTFV